MTFDIGPNATALLKGCLAGPALGEVLRQMGQRFDEITASLAALESVQADAVAAQRETQQHVLDAVGGLKATVADLQQQIAALTRELAAGGLSTRWWLTAGIRAIDPSDPTTIPPAPDAGSA